MAWPIYGRSRAETLLRCYHWFCNGSQRIPISIHQDAIGHCGCYVQDIGEIPEEVYPVQTAGACKRVKDASTLCADVAAEEEEVVSGEGDISVRAFDKVVVPEYVTITYMPSHSLRK